MLKTITLISTMIFLHNGDLQPKNTFSDFPCVKEKIYLEGLNDANAYAIVDNYFYIMEDQQLFNLNQDIEEIKIYANDEGSLIKTLYIEWINDCAIVTQAPYITTKNTTTTSLIPKEENPIISNKATQEKQRPISATTNESSKETTKLLTTKNTSNYTHIKKQSIENSKPLAIANKRENKPTLLLIGAFLFILILICVWFVV